MEGHPPSTRLWYLSNINPAMHAPDSACADSSTSAGRGWKRTSSVRSAGQRGSIELTEILHGWNWAPGWDRWSLTFSTSSVGYRVHPKKQDRWRAMKMETRGYLSGTSTGGCCSIFQGRIYIVYITTFKNTYYYSILAAHHTERKYELEATSAEML